MIQKEEPTDTLQAKEPFPDKLNEQIGVLTRRETEVRILKPLLDALSSQFGEEQVLNIVRDTVIKIARQQGADLARGTGNCTLQEFADSLKDWKRGQAMETDVLEQNDQVFSFNVTRCRYAEMYQSLGIPELGALLSCNRDFSLIEGFNPDIMLTRRQTIMQGAAFCDFRYRHDLPTVNKDQDQAGKD